MSNQTLTTDRSIGGDFSIKHQFFNPELCRNETEVESKFIVHYLLPALGYSPFHWSQEIAYANIRLDFLVASSLSRNSPPGSQLIIEAKHPQQNLNRHAYKFQRYLKLLGVHYGILTNGKLLRIYKQTEGQVQLQLELLGREVEQRLSEIKRVLGQKELVIKALEIEQKSIKPLFTFKQNSLTFKGSKEMKIIAIYHNKGGVGKTTTVINLAAALSRKGQRVLVIDLDSQANTTYAAGLVKFQDEIDDNIIGSYIYHVILEKNKCFIPEAVRKSYFTKTGFDVVPSHIDLMEHERELVEVAPSLTRLDSKLQKVKDDYDIVIIDTPPSLNLYAKIALIAADYLIIPSDLKPFANEGLRNVRNFINDIDEFREQIKKSPVKVLGVLPSKIATAHQFVKHILPKMEAIVQEKYGFPLLKTKIFERRDISAAVEKTIQVGDLIIPDPVSIFDHEQSSQGAEEFEALAKEVIELIGIQLNKIEK